MHRLLLRIIRISFYAALHMLVKASPKLTIGVFMKSPVYALCFASLAALTACNSDNGSGSRNSLDLPAQYAFDSTFTTGESSVSYQGQICRHVLITALKNAVQDEVEIAGQEYRGDAVPYLDDTIVGARAAQQTQDILGTALPQPADHDTLGELCGTKHLDEKLAGNDTVTDFKDWNSEFQGVSGETSAEAFLRRLIRDVSEQAELGTHATGAPHYVSPEGLDYAQYIQKFLLMAVAFAQGTDDYLDDDVAGKGLLAAYEQDGTKPYAKLEHQFDEGYGYFGAARAYADRSDAANRSGVVDDNNDGFIDLNAEHNFGASTNAAKRDEGSDPASRTDFTGDAFTAFRTGRAIIAREQLNLADMSEQARNDLLEARNAAVAAWEAAIAATVVHYINDTLADLDAIDTGAFDIADLAKHFTEMKAFALGLQFNPRSPLHAAFDSQQSLFQRVHELMRDTPPCQAGVCSNDPAYRDDLMTARALLGQAYGFAQANLEVW